MFSHVGSFIARQSLGALALFVAVGGAAAAATGQFAVLGGENAADKTTVISNTGAGPALELQVAGGPPLVVDSAVAVPLLNASLLRGKRPADFVPAAGSRLLAMDGLGATVPGVSYQRGFVARETGSILISASGMCTVNDDNRLRLVVSVRRSSAEPWQGADGPTMGEGLSGASPVTIGCTALAALGVKKGDRFQVRLEVKRPVGQDARVDAMAIFVWFDERDLH